jgi:hypothetical protein
VARCHFGTFANWYALVVSKARQAGLILEEVHSLRMIVGASLRARHTKPWYTLRTPRGQRPHFVVPTAIVSGMRSTQGAVPVEAWAVVVC